MDIKVLNYLDCNNVAKQKVKEIYLEAFPKEERFDFDILEKCNIERTSELNAITVVNNVIGMSFIVKYDDENNNKILYLMYFAVDKKYRNKGYGSVYLKSIVDNNVLLCIERTKSDDIITIKRKTFYIRNGFFDSNFYFIDTGVEYEVLSSFNNYVPSKETMLGRYKYMTNNVELTKCISTAFDMESIKVVDEVII